MDDMIGVMFLPIIANAPTIAGAFERLAAIGLATMTDAADQRQRDVHDTVRIEREMERRRAS